MAWLIWFMMGFILYFLGKGIKNGSFGKVFYSYYLGRTFVFGSFLIFLAIIIGGTYTVVSFIMTDPSYLGLENKARIAHTN